MLRCYRSCARAPLTLNTIHYRTQREALYTLRRFLSHYKTLGVAKDCTAAEIKSSYYESAKQCHPDIFPEDGDKLKQFLKLQEAYIILSDPNKRRVYDGGQTKPNIPTSPGARGVRYTETQYTQYQGSNNYSHSKRGQQSRRTGNQSREIRKLLLGLTLAACSVWGSMYGLKILYNIGEPKSSNQDMFYEGNRGRPPGHGGIMAGFANFRRNRRNGESTGEESDNEDTKILKELNAELEKELSEQLSDTMLERKRLHSVKRQSEVDSAVAEYEKVRRKEQRKRRRKRVKELRELIKEEIAKNNSGESGV